MELAHGIAHVSFSGGGVFLPARDPYDRQILIEHVMQRVGAKGRVQVLVDSHRWMVQRIPSTARTVCAACGQAADAVCYNNTNTSVAYCMYCALGSPTHLEQLHHEEWRQVG